jgi:integrase
MPQRPKHAPIQCQYFIWHLRQRDGVFYADGRSNRPSLGKHSLGTRERDDAMDRLRQLDLQKAIELGRAEPNPADQTSHSLSINDGWQLYLARCEDPEILGGVSRATRERYSPVRDKHVQFCVASRIVCWSQVDKNITNDYGRWLAKKKNLADRTIVLELNLICSVVKWLVEENYLPAKCRFLLKLSKPDGTTTFCYTKEQVKSMITYCRAESALRWLGNVLAALAATGLRINELAKLRWTDVDFEAGTICITDERSRPRRRQSGLERRLKGKRGRALPLNLSLRKLLLQLPHHRDGIVFRGKNGGKVDDRRVLEALQGKVIMHLLEAFPTPEGEIGFQDGTVHGLRHYFVSEAYRNGATDAELMEWLGHRDSQLLRIYRHLRPEDGHRKMQKIDFLGLCEESQQPRNTA